MDNNVPFTPVNFFQVRIDCQALPAKQTGFALTSKNYSKYLLPDMTTLTDKPTFAKVALGWSREGIEFFVYVEQAYLKTSYPLLDKGDSFEICLDTRDVKTSGYNTRFCHHFFFLPEAVEGVQAGERTKFRTEDAHELCNPQDLKVESQLKSNHYILHCFIPAFCLSGFDPDQFDRLGMTYRVNRANGSSQEFSVAAEDFKFEEQPSLWSSVRLLK